MMLSLSARRAWIEIAAIRLAVLAYYVALRKESVDRNLAVWAVEHAYQSLSARRAWIEIKSSIEEISKYVVSLSARRAWIEILPPAQKK